MEIDDRVWAELVESASEVKYKSQRLKDALAAAHSVRKTASFSDKPVAWFRPTSSGGTRFIDYEPDPKIEGSGWVPLYIR